MILHTLSNPAALVDCLAAVGTDDTVLLLGDGVYCALPGSESAQALERCDASVQLIGSDALATGLAPETLPFRATDMAGFVALTEYYPRQMAWY